MRVPLPKSVLTKITQPTVYVGLGGVILGNGFIFLLSVTKISQQVAILSPFQWVAHVLDEMKSLESVHSNAKTTPSAHRGREPSVAVHSVAAIV